MNLLLVDDSIYGLSTFLNSINLNTKYVIYNTIDNLDTIIKQINELNTINFDNIAFIFSSNNNYIESKIFLDNKQFISYIIENNDTQLINNQENIIIIENEVTIFIKYLINRYSVKNIDFLACNLLSNKIWKSYFEYLQLDNKDNIIIRASNDKTGNLSSGGDWILETTNENIQMVYFNSNIEYWNYLLDNDSASSSVSLLTLDNSNNLYTAGDNICGELGRNFIRNFTNNYAIPNEESKLKYSIYNKKIINIVGSSGLTCFALLTDETSNNLYVYGPPYNSNLGIDAISKIPSLSSRTATSEYTGWFTNVKYDTNEYLINNKRIIDVSISSSSILVLSDETSNNLYGSGQLGFISSPIFININNLINSLLNKKIVTISCNHTSIAGLVILTNESSNNLYVCGNERNIGISSINKISSFRNKNSNEQFFIPNKRIINVVNTNNSVIAITDESINNIYTTGYDLYGCTLRGITTNTYSLTYSNLKNDGNPIISQKVIEIQAFYNSIILLTSETTNNVYIGGVFLNIKYPTLTNIGITTTSLNDLGFISYISSINSYYYINNSNSINNLNYSGHNFFGAVPYLNSNNYDIYSAFYSINSINYAGTTSNNNNINGLNDKTISKIKTFPNYKLTFVITNDTSNNLYIAGIDSTIGNKNNYIDYVGLNTREFSNKNIANLENKRIIKTFNTNLKSIAITNENDNNLYLSGALYYSGIGSFGGSNYIPISCFTNKGIPSSSYSNGVVSNGIMLNKKVIDCKTSTMSGGNYQTTAVITNENSNNLYISTNDYDTGFGLGTYGTGISSIFSNKKISNNELIFPNKKIISICSIPESFYNANNSINGGILSTLSILTNESSNNLYYIGIITPGLYGRGTTSIKTITSFTNLRWDNQPIMPNKMIIKSITSQFRTFSITSENSNNLYVTGYNGPTGALGINDNTTTYIYEYTNPYNTIENGNEFKNKKIIDVYISGYGSICLTDETSNNVYVTGNIDRAFLGLSTNNNSYCFVSLTNQALIKSSPILPFIYNKKITNIQVLSDSYINYISDFRDSNKNIILGRINSITSGVNNKTAGYLGYNSELNYEPTRYIPNRPFSDDISANMNQPFIDRSVYNSVQLHKNGFDNLYFSDDNAIYTSVPTDSISIINHNIENNINGILNASKYFTLDPIESYLIEHISFDISVSQYKNVEIYSRNYKNEITFISSNNTSNDDIYYTYNPLNGIVKIYCKYFSTIIIKTVTIPPSINTLNIEPISNVYDVSFNSNDSEIIYPDTSSNILNTINVKSTYPTINPFLNNKIKGYLQLYPENTSLTNHISFNINVPVKRAIDVYYRTNNSNYIIPKTNNASNNYYYTYTPSSGIVTIKSKKLNEIYIIEKKPIINILSNDVSNVNISTNISVIYNTDEDVSNNEINVLSSTSYYNYNIQRIKKYVNLSPPNTSFTEHIDFELKVQPFKSYKIHFKSQNDDSPYIIPQTNNVLNDVYYSQTNDSVKIYTKHFSEVFISENEPNLQILNNNYDTLLSNFTIPINNSITYSNFEDSSNNIIRLISKHSSNYTINKQLAYVTMEPSNISISGEHLSYDITLSYTNKPINVYYKLYNDISYTLINPSNNSINDIYYIYDPSYGLIHIYSNKAIEIIVNEIEPNINIINNNEFSMISNFNYGYNSIIYPNSSNVTNNTITCTSESVSNLYNLTNIKSRVILEPHGTQFENHINYKITVPNNNPIKVYFKNNKDINPTEIPSSNTILNDVYYEYNETVGIVTIYTKHFSESLVIQNESNQSINFYIQQFNYSITMTSGTFNKEEPNIYASDSIANFYVKTQDIRNVFMFKSNSLDINETSISDIKYFVRMSLWPNNLVINPCHAWVQHHHEIANSDKYGTIPDNRQLVKHDFIRYISKELFNTHLATDLFLNENVLKYDLAWKGHYKVWNDIKNTLHNVDTIDLSVNLFNESMYGIDPIYGKYLTNDASGNENLCRKLINQMMSVSPSRFKNLNDIAIDISNGYYYVPFMNNDSISFILTLNPANNQHKLVNRSNPIPPRTYKIQINIKDDVVNSFNRIEGSNVIVDDTSPSTYLGETVTDNLNYSYPSNYTI